MSNQVRVIDSFSKTVLFETSIEYIAEAHDFATQMEAMGLDIEILAPSLTDTLIHSLGATDRDIEEYHRSLEEEIEDHDTGCAFCPPKRS